MTRSQNSKSLVIVFAVTTFLAGSTAYAATCPYPADNTYFTSSPKSAGSDWSPAKPCCHAVPGQFGWGYVCVAALPPPPLGSICQGGTPFGIKTFLNSALVSDIVIDTSQVATDTIDYVVTDPTDLTAISTRTILIEPASTPRIQSQSLKLEILHLCAKAFAPEICTDVILLAILSRSFANVSA
jgi:hypothetical protein